MIYTKKVGVSLVFVRKEEGIIKSYMLEMTNSYGFLLSEIEKIVEKNLTADENLSYIGIEDVFRVCELPEVVMLGCTYLEDFSTEGVDGMVKLKIDKRLKPSQDLIFSLLYKYKSDEFAISVLTKTNLLEIEDFIKIVSHPDFIVLFVPKDMSPDDFILLGIEDILNTPEDDISHPFLAFYKDDVTPEELDSILISSEDQLEAYEEIMTW